MQKIYLKTKPKSVEELLHRVIFVQERTYKDKEAEKVQTSAHRDRSLIDINLILKTYFRKKKIKEARKIIKKLVKTYEVDKFRCNDIKRVILSPNSCIPMKFEEFKKIINEQTDRSSPSY